MERKAFCFEVGGSEPVAHWEGLLSWEDISGGGVCLEGCEIVLNVLGRMISVVTACGSMTDTSYSWKFSTILRFRRERNRMTGTEEEANNASLL